MSNFKSNWMRDLALQGARYVLIEIEKQKLEIYKRFPELKISYVEAIDEASKYRPSNGKRSKYSTKFKNKVMAEAITTGKVTATGLKYKVPRSVLTKWLSNK